MMLLPITPQLTSWVHIFGWFLQKERTDLDALFSRVEAYPTRTENRYLEHWMPISVWLKRIPPEWRSGIYLEDCCTMVEAYPPRTEIRYLNIGCLLHLAWDIPLQNWDQVFGLVSLWHKVDISNFQCHKNMNFHNNFVGLMIADDLKSKIWKL